MAAVPDGSTLVTSSSMPVRDVEWFGEPRTGVRVLANRGANGIDGVVSTAVGVALATGAPTALLIGDVALLHDTNGLLGLGGRPVALTIVVVDNDGGGIFSFLPQRTALAGDRFEQLFGTPHGVDLAELARVHGVVATIVTTAAEVGPAVADARPPPAVPARAGRTDRPGNVAVHDEIDAAVRPALDGLGLSRPPGRSGTGSGADEGRQHRLQLGPGLGQFGDRDRRSPTMPLPANTRAVAPSISALRMATAQVPLPAASTQPTVPP